MELIVHDKASFIIILNSFSPETDFHLFDDASVENDDDNDRDDVM